jgi:hypothetical protein
MIRTCSFFGMLALVVFAPGCGPDIQGLCEKQESCLGGNEADIDACVVAYDGARDNAHDIGCGDEYDLFVDCLIPQYGCVDVGTCSTSDECNGSACVNGECKNFGIDASNADACEAELNAYSRCD